MFGLNIHFEKREKENKLMHLLIPVVCIILALFVSGIVMEALGHDSILAYQFLFKGGFGSWRNISESILQAVPLMFCGLGVAVAAKMSVNNIGAEGQFTLGAWAATGVALYAKWIPNSLVLPAALIAGFLAGGIWAVIAVFPKAKWGVNETIITLMFNYVALLFVDYFVYGSWRDTSFVGTNLPYSETLPPHARMSYLGNTRITWAIFIAIIAAALIWIFFEKTVLGYQIRVIGSNVKAATYAGMKISRNMLIIMLISGGLAGLGGVATVTGAVGCLQPNLASGAGYTAIVISYMSQHNPFVVLIVSILFGGLTQGGFNVQIAGVPAQIVTLIQGLILFFILGGNIFARKRLVITRRVKVGSSSDELASSKGGTR
ncbi:MAG: ABC transporter permease [Eubacteriales bacterium]|nr:ABC transporter permease [Eubacteriales bacterium]